ncbi:MAG: hypothetical protein FWH46_06890, partial [Methanimicrococcus sp.]|nr:hypothetical protein [Methanimicrococcus sp.]
IFHLAYKVNYLRRQTLTGGGKSLEKQLREWEGKLTAARRKSTFFAITSSLMNIDVLGIDYFKDNSNPEINPKHVFRTSFLSIKPLSVDEMFYGQLKEKHFYRATYNYDYVDSFYGGQENVKKHTTCLRDTDIDYHSPLHVSLDFGNMISMVIAQRYEHEIKIINEFHVLIPDILDDITALFCDYYEPHRKKMIYLFYDRSGNNHMSNSRKTYAEHTQSALQSRGWAVQLMSVDQGNISHSAKWILINDMLAETNTERYPTISINEDNCKCLKSSLNMAPSEKYKGAIRKVKKSEKLPLQRLPMESTNMSDAFDYIIWGLFRQLLSHSSSRGNIVIGDTSF